jgi:hypothetical protein
LDQGALEALGLIWEVEQEPEITYFVMEMRKNLKVAVEAAARNI